MKKLFISLCCCGVLVLSGCSLSETTSKVNNFLDSVIKKDQQHEQWFEVTKEMLYSSFDKTAKRIDLSGNDLLSVPDICGLLDPEDYTEVRWLDISQNDIRILNTDLSCLTFLKSLDLSKNSIQSVQTVWSLPALQELNMEYNELTTTENFPDFPVLEKLNLAYNKLKEVKDLDHLKNLVILELQNNVIEHIVWVENLEQLKQLKLDYDKVKSWDISPILDKLGELEIIDALWNRLWEQLKDKILNWLPF